MANLPIITYPDSILSKKTALIKDAKDPLIQELILDMIETMQANDGLGIAAPQVGRSLRLCVIRLEGKTYVLINPKFKHKSWRKIVEEEGCLSFPGEHFPVKRSRCVTVEALDRKGEPLSLKAEGMLARALQHEIDHLDGVLFISRRAKKRKPIIKK